MKLTKETFQKLLIDSPEWRSKAIMALVGKKDTTKAGGWEMPYKWDDTAANTQRDRDQCIFLAQYLSNLVEKGEKPVVTKMFVDSSKQAFEANFKNYPDFNNSYNFVNFLWPILLEKVSALLKTA